VLKEIRNALKLPGDQPGAAHVREDLTNRPLKLWPVYSYLIAYDPEAKPVRIIRVLHGMRDVEEILN
jgi:plasmid stabilization system protein ParE